ncbi:MAG: 30S ribosomal protein S15 [Candidatus Gracilibacteria bacterium]|nr:30S ribosomal protein S15 [Candidatus Gracilibacteria bacterium]
MAVTKDSKKKLIKDFGGSEKNSGSAEVQVAILTARIEELKNHLQEHKKDNHSRRGIMLMVAKRRKMLNYLKKKDPKKYEEVLEKLNIRK